MPSQLRLGGWSDLRAWLASLPTTARAQSDPILLGHAMRSQAAVKAAYPRVTGKLQDGVTLTKRPPRGIATLYTVATTAYYAHIYEFGTVMKAPRATFLPITERDRRAAVTDLIAMLEGMGLDVGGPSD